MVGNENTEVNLLHRDFGPNEMALYYFPQVNSSVKGANQSCFYPGEGPNPVVGNSQCLDPNGGCILNDSYTADTDTGCATGDTNLTPSRVRDVNTCLENLRDEQVSPFSR